VTKLKGPNTKLAVSTEYPIYIVHQSGYMGAAVSKAIELMGYTKDTKDPDGVVIPREPNGVFEELAHGPALIKMLSRLGPGGAKELARAGSELWAR